MTALRLIRNIPKTNITKKNPSHRTEERPKREIVGNTCS
jgi:hypothetical protein